MECQCAPAHVVGMTLYHSTQMSVLNASLGEAARGRGQVDLLVEATRLNFSEQEIAELKRLYEVLNPALNTNMPQKPD